MGAKPNAEQLAVSGQRGPLRALANSIQSGVATLSGGTIIVTGVELTAASVITISRNTPGGTLGNLSAPVASRNVGASTFVIDSDAAETSTVDWKVEG